MKPIRELSRRGRLYRFRKLAEEAVHAYGLGGSQLSFIQYGENIIYRLDLTRQDERKRADDIYIPNRFVVRIHAMADIAAITSELTWLAALSEQAGLPVPAPVKTPDGQLLATITAPDIPLGRVVSVLRWLDGRCVRKGLRTCHLTALGEAVARMHAFSASWQPPQGFSRSHWNWDSQLGGSMFDRPLDELVASMPEKFREPFMIISSKARQVMGDMGTTSDVYGLIHSDLYPENVLYKGGRALPIDFEDCGYGYWMWDIAVALCQWAWGSQWERMRDAFREGYSRNRMLSEAQWAQLDLFVATQFATMLLWSTMFLKHDPKRKEEYEPWRDDSGKKLSGYFTR